MIIKIDYKTLILKLSNKINYNNWILLLLIIIYFYSIVKLRLLVLLHFLYFKNRLLSYFIEMINIFITFINNYYIRYWEI